jgi:glycosyltransferase involved in cell wall biosynthesis
VTPPASVIIATWNHAASVGAAIESVLAQTLDGVEVIVVDDGSTDDTAAVLARYDGVRILSQPNRGPEAARNAGLAWARAPYVGFLDADDLFAPTKLEVQARVLDAEPRLGWTYCDVRIEDETGTPPTTVSRREGYAARRLDGWLFGELVRGNFIPLMAPLIRRSALDVAGPFDERLTGYEDWDLWLRLARVAEARYVPDVLATYRVHREGRSRNRTRMDANRFAVVEKLERQDGPTLRALGVPGRRIVADMHNWFAYEAYARGDWSEAVRRLSASVRCLPVQGRAPLMLAAAIGRRWLG